MAGLANKSLPFTSDGYFAVASNFELPIHAKSIEGKYIFQLNKDVGNLGEVQNPEVIVDNATIVQINLPPPNGIEDSRYPEVLYNLITAQITSSGLGYIGDNPIANVVSSETYQIPIRNPNKGIGEIKSQIISEVHTSISIPKTHSTKLGSNPLEA